MATFQVVSGEAVIFTFRADFTAENSPIQICERSGQQLVETPFRVSDSRSRPIAAARLLNTWCRTNGRKCWEKGTRSLTLRRLRRSS
jgi:hypothetical protein